VETALEKSLYAVNVAVEVEFCVCVIDGDHLREIDQDGSQGKGFGLVF
jgi:hypothetical protein